MKKFVFLRFSSLLVLVAWYVAWVAAVIFVQRFSTTVAYVLSVYLIFSFYWTCQGKQEGKEEKNKKLVAAEANVKQKRKRKSSSREEEKEEK